jgi:hypothetical protein
MQPSTAADRKSVSLAAFTANDVYVSIQLEGDQNMVPLLSATFIPPDGYHLYSKDVPRKGTNGLGRPTLLELMAGSRMKAISELMESVAPQVPSFEPKELLVYPSGEVTLSMEVELPPGDEWLDDSVSVTYMACSDQLCKPPVVAKIVAVRIPAADFFNTP